MFWSIIITLVVFSALYPFGFLMPKGQRVQGFVESRVCLLVVAFVNSLILFAFKFVCITFVPIIWWETYATLSLCLCQVSYQLLRCYLSCALSLCLHGIAYVFIHLIFLMQLLPVHKIQGGIDPNLCVLHSKSIPKQCTHLGGAHLYFVDVGIACYLIIFLCKYRVVINPPNRGRLLGHISPLVVLLIDDNAFAD